MGCIAIAEFLEPATSAKPADPLPPPPPPAETEGKYAPLTLKDAGVKMGAAHMAKLKELAKERDGHRNVKTATEGEWRDLMERARCLFRDAALPLNVSRLLG